MCRQRILKQKYAMLVDVRERFIRDGANAENPCDPTLPEDPSDSLIESFRIYKHWKDQVQSTKRTALHIMLHTPGVIAIMALFYW